MVNVQPSYATSLAVGLAGMPADMSTWDGDSMLVETAAGIGFGLAVSSGSAENGVVLGGTVFRGVTIRDITLVTPAGGTVDKYQQYDLAGVMIRGDIWVNVITAVTPASPVIYNASTGAFGGAAGQQLTGARYIRGNGGSAGLALLRLGGTFTQSTV